MRRLLKPLWFLIAVLFLVEAWFWERIEPALVWLGRVLPWARLKAALAGAIGGLPPYAALLVFAVPLAIVEPLKLLALWHFAQGRMVAGVLTFAFAQIAALGLSVLVFDLVRDKLLTIGWFAKLYGWVHRFHAWAREQVAPARRAIARMVRVFRLEGGRLRRRLSLLRGQMRRRAGAR